jgi:hypothetical protein
VVAYIEIDDAERIGAILALSDPFQNPFADGTARPFMIRSAALTSLI